MSRTVVLAYSGGLDTSVCVRWLTERGYRVIAFMADVGAARPSARGTSSVGNPSAADTPSPARIVPARSQGEPEAEAVRRAKRAGAVEVIVRDLRREFAKDYILPALKAHAVYEGKYLLATALSRPLIAKHLVEVAHQKGAEAVAHGCTGKGNDQVRFEVSVRALDAGLRILAPVREWEFRSRQEELAYLKANRIPIQLKAKSLYSVDENLWGVSIEAGGLEEPWTEAPSDSYRWITPPEQAPAKGMVLTVEFQRGVPMKLNGRRLELVALINRACELASAHGVGRTDMIESRVVGIKSREVYEAPAATVLMEAHAELERMVLDRELLHFKQAIGLKYAELIYYGLWFTPLKAALDAFVEKTQARASGEVRVRVSRGTCQAVARRSPHALYQKRLATYEAGDAFDQSLAAGFVKLWGLPYEAVAKWPRGKVAK